MSVASTLDRSTAAPKNVVVFVAPPEAVSVLRAVLSELSVGFPAAIVILLHAGDGHERPVAHNLNVSSGLMVMPGVTGTELRQERAYVALPADNLVIDADGRLTAAGPSETLLSSLASRYGSGAIAIALTALDEREAEGFRRVREAGGHTIALDEADRLWTHPAGPRVVPAPADELLPASAIGTRMLAMLVASSSAA